MQTFQPDARPIIYAARHDVTRFLAEELERRRDARLPAVQPSRADRRLGARTGAGAARLRRGSRRHAATRELLGPAPLLRLRGAYRAQLIGKTDRPTRRRDQAARLLTAAAPAMRRAGLAAVVDVDPQSL